MKKYNDEIKSLTINKTIYGLLIKLFIKINHFLIVKLKLKLKLTLKLN